MRSGRHRAHGSSVQGRQVSCVGASPATDRCSLAAFSLLHCVVRTENETGEVHAFWYACDNAVHSAKLKDSLVGEEREKFWSARARRDAQRQEAQASEQCSAPLAPECRTQPLCAPFLSRMCPGLRSRHFSLRPSFRRSLRSRKRRRQRKRGSSESRSILLIHRSHFLPRSDC